MKRHTNLSGDFHRQQIQQALYTLRRVGPEEYANYLVSLFTAHSFSKAIEQFQELQELFTTLTVATKGFQLDAAWQHQEDTSKAAPASTLPDPALSIQQAAEYMGVKKGKIYKLIHDEQLAKEDLGTPNKPYYRIRQSALDNFRRAS